jgi:hypothetical protein
MADGALALKPGGWARPSSPASQPDPNGVLGLFRRPTEAVDSPNPVGRRIDPCICAGPPFHFCRTPWRAQRAQILDTLKLARRPLPSRDSYKLPRGARQSAGTGC